jgi:hypothetical protein
MGLYLRPSGVIVTAPSCARWAGAGGAAYLPGVSVVNHWPLSWSRPTVIWRGANGPREKRNETRAGVIDMGAKTLLVAAGFAAGYVVGTRRGRKGYEELKRQAADFVNDPRVQKGLSDAETFVADKVPVVGDTVASAIGAVRQAARKSSTRGGASSTSDTPTTTPTTPTTPTTTAAPTSATTGDGTPSPTSAG